MVSMKATKPRMWPSISPYETYTAEITFTLYVGDHVIEIHQLCIKTFKSLHFLAYFAYFEKKKIYEISFLSLCPPYRLKTEIVEPVKVAVVRQRFGKNVPAEKKTHATIQELLYVMFILIKIFKMYCKEILPLFTLHCMLHMQPSRW